MSGRRWWWIGGAVLALAVVTGAGVALYPQYGRPALGVANSAIVEQLRGAQEIELLSLNPGRPPETGEKFQGWEVLGRTPLKGATDRDPILNALAKGLAETDGGMAACFNPRHGIRAVRNGVATDLVICFECWQIQVIAGGGRSETLSVRDSPEAQFDALLTSRGIVTARGLARGKN